MIQFIALLPLLSILLLLSFFFTDTEQRTSYSEQYFPSTSTKVILDEDKASDSESYKIIKIEDEDQQNAQIKTKSGWEFSELSEDSEVFTNLFLNSEPSYVLYDDGESLQKVFPKVKDEKKSTSKVLYLSTKDALNKVEQQRTLNKLGPLENSPGPKPKKNTKNPQNENKAAVTEYISKDGFDLALHFEPGFTQDPREYIFYPSNLISRVMALDYNFRQIDENDSEGLEQLRSRVLSFGHHGQLKIELLGSKLLIDKEGPDFVVFENVFKVGRRGYYQELAYIGVALEDHETAYKWFDCRPHDGVKAGCAGVVPSESGYGGDRFDLSVVGMEKVRYIILRDVGSNHSLGSGAEGFDLDTFNLFE